jgi:hypothetical protein
MEKTKKILLILLFLLMMPAFFWTINGYSTVNAQAATTPVWIFKTVAMSLVLPAPPALIYTVPAAKSFALTNLVLMNNAPQGAIGGQGDLTNITVQVTKAGVGVPVVLPIVTLGLVANTSFSQNLQNIVLSAGDKLEVINGSNTIGNPGGPVNILITGQEF